MHESLERIAVRYQRFAELEAEGRSPLYAHLAREVSNDRFALEFLAELPSSKQQPNLFFAAIRSTSRTPKDWSDCRRMIASHHDDIRRTMLARRTQTNEPARCATLLPVLATISQPVALLELGASAGLCLIPDRYAYAYNAGSRIPPTSEIGVPPPTFSCEGSPNTPIPSQNLQVLWRAGIDLEPISVCDQDDTAWLEALVWPGEEDRLTLLRQALEVARREPPSVIKGDAGVELPALASQVPTSATLVVFHSAMFAYISSEERTAIANTITKLNAVWISNEACAVSPVQSEGVPAKCPDGEFLLARNKQPIACTDPHGRWIRWF